MTRLKTSFWMTLLVACLLTGCIGVSPPAEAENSAAKRAGQPHVDSGDVLSLPQPTATSQPTKIATAVATYSATNTRTPTPTRAPTKVPTVTATPTATETLPPPPQKEVPETIKHVVIISIDGLRPDALALADTPTLDGLRLSGAFSAQAKAVVPSVTLINHASMLGGMSPEKHGIDWNVADAEKGTITGPTLFSVAHDAGLSTAMVVGKDKLSHLVLPNSVDNYIYAGFTDFQVEAQAIEIIETHLPDVLFIHLPNVDSAGHLTGWMSAGQMEAVTMADSTVGSIVNALQSSNNWNRTLLLVTSDHGGSGTSHGSDSPEDTTIPWLAVGPGVPQNQTLTGQIVVFDTAATALHALNLPVPPLWDGQPVPEIFPR